MLEKTAVIREYVRWCEGTEAKTNAFVESTGLNVTLASSYSISKQFKILSKVRSTVTILEKLQTTYPFDVHRVIKK